MVVYIRNNNNEWEKIGSADIVMIIKNEDDLTELCNCERDNYIIEERNNKLSLYNSKAWKTLITW